MRALPRPQTGEGAAAVTALVVILVCALVIGLTPVRERPEAAVVLLVIAAVAGGVVGAVAFARRARARHTARHVEQAVVEAAWFTDTSLEDFPEQALTAVLPAAGGPSRQRLQTAWILATHGRDAAWLQTHLDLPRDIARLLADTAHRGASPQT